MEAIVRQKEIILLCSRALALYDERLVQHGSRVAYLSAKLREKLPHPEELDLGLLLTLSIFHDIGAYKTEEINRLVQFETGDVASHAIYGYLFLRHLSPLGDAAEAVLYHHTPWHELREKNSPMAAYAQILHMADRLDIGLMKQHKPDRQLAWMRNSQQFATPYTDALAAALEDEEFLYPGWQDYAEPFCIEALSDVHITEAKARDYLQMVIYTIDFKSETTVLHSMHTTLISMFLGEKIGLSEVELLRLYYGALLHDIGKMAIPCHILEFPGRYNEEQMEIMKLHVSYTERILQDILLDESVIRIASRHHEKLNGKGYPHGIDADRLTMSERIVAVADVTSALVDRRSYKGEYDWDKTLGILENMAETEQIDEGLVHIIRLHHEELAARLNAGAAPIVANYRKVQEGFARLFDGKRPACKDVPNALLNDLWLNGAADTAQRFAKSGKTASRQTNMANHDRLLRT